MRSRTESLPTHLPLWSGAFIAVIGILRTAWLTTFSPDKLVQFVPDDAFYYLTLARNFSHTGFWSFDKVAPASGFHPLWGYILAAFYYVNPGISLRTIFLIASLIGVTCLAVSTFLVSKTTQRLFGPKSILAVVFIFAGTIALQIQTWMMEGPLAIFFASLLFYYLYREEKLPQSGIVVAFFLGLMGTVSRSDFGLIVLWIALVFFYYRKQNKDINLIGSISAFAGSVAGIIFITFHTYWISKNFFQASAQEKAFWTKTEGHSFYAAAHVLYQMVNPMSNAFPPFLPPSPLHKAAQLIGGGFRVIALWGIAYLIWKGLKDHWQDKQKYLVISCIGIILSYISFYYFDSVAIQAWYSTHLYAPLAFLAAASLSLLGNKSWRAVVIVALICTCCSVFFSLKPTTPWQEAMYRAGIYLHNHPENLPEGSWNSGIIGFFSEGGVINLDGLVNDEILPYSKSGTLAAYVYKRQIKSILESPSVLDNIHMQRRGGYAGGVLRECLKNPVDLFPDDPLNNYDYTHITLYTVDRNCLKRYMP